MSNPKGPGRTVRTVSASCLWAERVAWAGGIAALTLSMAAGVAGSLGTRGELERFAAQRDGNGSVNVPRPDFSSWAPGRVRAWYDSQTRDAPPPLAVLRIPRFRLEVPVLPGTDDWTLNRGVGHIEDTAAPGTDGNSGIAGHRDGFFRVLKDIRLGDVLEIETLRSVERYRVERTWIVTDEYVSVLDPTATPAVTLVTCYPFYFVGHAPQRFVVRGVRIASTPSGFGSSSVVPRK